MIPLEEVDRVLGEGRLAAPQQRPGATDVVPSDIPPPLYGKGAAAAAAGSSSAEEETTEGLVRRARRFLDLIGADGSLDIDAVYKFGKIPETRVSADMLCKAQAALPQNAPAEARRAAFRATVLAVLGPAGASPAEIVADAKLRSRRLSQFLSGLESETAPERQERAERVRKMEEELAAERAGLAVLDDALNVARRDCTARISALLEVAHLLAEPKAAGEP